MPMLDSKVINVYKLTPYDRSEVLLFFYNVTQEEALATINAGNMHNVPKSMSQIKTVSRSKELLREMLNDSPETFDTFNGFHQYDEEFKKIGLRVIWMNKVGTLRDFYATLSHELLHLCQTFLPRYLNRNVELEAEAYFHSNLLRAISEEVEQNASDYEIVTPDKSSE